MSVAPNVSVIMPAYGAADTIEASVISVQGQTLDDWELIIVDDGSPDDTADVAKQLAANDSRVRLVRQSNAGPSAARNTGLRSARAKVIAFLDADDLWAEQRLSGMLQAFAEQPKAGVLFSRTRFVDEETLALGTLTSHVRQLSAADLMAENAVCSSSNIVCRRQVLDQIGPFRPGLNFAEDQDWLLRVALDGEWEIRGVDAEWFFYRSSASSQSADLEAMRRGWWSMVDRARECFPEETEAPLRDAIGPIHRQLARRALRLGRSLEAVRYLRMAVMADPFLIARQPKRTLLTAAGLLVSFIPHPKLKELVVK